MRAWLRRRRVRPSPRRKHRPRRLPGRYRDSGYGDYPERSLYQAEQSGKFLQRASGSLYEDHLRTDRFLCSALFIIINQILRNKDLKDDLRDMEEMGANMGGYGQETYGDKRKLL